MKKRFHRALPWLAGLCGLGLVAAIVAPAVAFATDDDHAAAERIVSDLEHDSPHRMLTQDAVTHAKQALERSLRMRQAGDDARAREVDALARGWAELGRDLAQTADTEARAGVLRAAANDAGAHAERERALLEESIMRNARMKAEIESAQREETQAPTHTAAVGKNADAGAPKSTSTVDLRPSTIDHRPSTIDHRPSTIDHRPSTIDHRPSTSTSKADGGVQ